MIKNCCFVNAEFLCNSVVTRVFSMKLDIRTVQAKRGDESVSSCSDNKSNKKTNNNIVAIEMNDEQMIIHQKGDINDDLNEDLNGIQHVTSRFGLDLTSPSTDLIVK